MTSITEDTARSEYVAGLRALADLLEGTPDLGAATARRGDPMTAPDPLAAHTSAAQQRILTAAEWSALTPAEKLARVRNGLSNYHHDRDHLHTISDRQLCDLVRDLADVVEHLAGQMGGAS